MTFDLLSNLLSLVCLIAMNVAVTWGIHGAMMTTGFNEPLKFLPEWIRKPLYDCPICQPTVWTIPVMLACGANPGNTSWLTYVMVWLGTSGVNYVIIQFKKDE